MATLAGVFVGSPALACTGPNCSLTSSQKVSSIKPPDFDTLATFATVGEAFAFSRANVVNVTRDGVASYASPFSFNVGGSVGTTNLIYTSENGAVSFGRPLGAGAFTSTGSLTGLKLPVIAPFYADLNQNSRTAIGAGLAGVVIQQGVADPFADAAGNYSLADAKAALRITWYGFDEADQPAGSATEYAQLLLIDEGGGDFDFKIRSGMPGSATANSPGGGIGGFAFGDNDYEFATPYDGSEAGSFAVRGGVATPFDSAVAAVPEPGTWTILMLGVGLAGASLRRRRNPARCARAPRWATAV